MPYDYFIRITHSYLSLAPLLGVWALQCEKLVAYEHVGTLTEKVHCHLVMLGSRIQKKQLRNLGQPMIDLKGNENCSFKECVSWEQPIVYMTKGLLDAVYNKGFDPAMLIASKAKWVAPKHYIKRSQNEVFYDSWENNEWKKLFVIVSDAKEAYRVALGVWQPVIGQENEMPDLNKYIFNAVKRYFHLYVFRESRHIWDTQTLMKYKMMVNTYCMREDITIPPKTDWSKFL